ncbi:MAG: S9 family peptidase, partial [Phycisphaeraceae bacterium]|nr:S9 family peptidase [Phycisphaeraceae bacterium]
MPISFGSVETGRRDFEWRDDAEAQLVWAEAQDGGDGGVQAENRDRIFMLNAPFKGEPETLITLGQRYGGIMWGNDDLAFVTSWWWTTRNIKTWQVHPGDVAVEPKLIIDRSWQDRYNDPGQPLTDRNKYGRQVILTADGGKAIFLTGEGASPEGNRPFLDKYDLASGETTRLFRSQAPWFENPVDLLDVGKLTMLTRRESQTEPP